MSMLTNVLVFSAALAHGPEIVHVPPPTSASTDANPPETVVVGVGPGEARFKVMPYVPDTFERKRTPFEIPVDPLSESETSVPVRPPAALYAVFERPAHFPLSGYSLEGWMIPREAAIVYEGMSLAVYGGGRYELRYAIEAPQTPVVVRLQLAVAHDGVPLGTITLPPVTVCPRPTHCGHPSRTWLVICEGWSPALAGLDCSPDAGRTTVCRAGTARFGSDPNFDFFAADLD